MDIFSHHTLIKSINTYLHLDDEEYSSEVVEHLALLITCLLSFQSQSDGVQPLYTTQSFIWASSCGGSLDRYKENGPLFQGALKPACLRRPN